MLVVCNGGLRECGTADKPCGLRGQLDNIVFFDKNK